MPASQNEETESQKGKHHIQGDHGHRKKEGLMDWGHQESFGEEVGLSFGLKDGQKLVFETKGKGIKVGDTDQTNVQK